MCFSPEKSTGNDRLHKSFVAYKREQKNCQNIINDENKQCQYQNMYSKRIKRFYYQILTKDKK